MRIPCPQCGKSLKCPDDAIGRRGQCPSCEFKFTIAAPSVEHSAQDATAFDASARKRLTSNPEDSTADDTSTTDDERQEQPMPETQSPSAQPSLREFHDFQQSLPTPDDFVYYRDAVLTVWHNGTATFACETLSDIKLSLKSLKLAKKQVRVLVTSCNAKLKDIRREYTTGIRTQGSKFPGGGTLGHFVRTFQSFSRDLQRAALANDLKPIEDQKANCERVVLAIEQYIVNLEHAKRAMDSNRG